MLRRAVGLIMVLAVTILLASPTYADVSCKHRGKNSGKCSGDDHGGPGDNPGPGHPQKKTPATCVDSTFSKPPRALACTSSLGEWSNDWQCYLKPYAGESTDPKQGLAYHCYSPPYAGGLDLKIVYGGTLGTPVDPQDVAREVVASLQLQAIHMGLAPRAGSTGLVQLPVWMWTAEPDVRTWGPATASKTEQELTVVVTAKVDSVGWNMGDGATVICGVGTARAAGGGNDASPDCGHTYKSTSAGKAGGSFTVTATSHWTITWVAGDQHGTFPFELSDTAQLSIIESRPVLTVP